VTHPTTERRHGAYPAVLPPEKWQPGALDTCAGCGATIRYEVRTDPAPGQPPAGWLHIQQPDDHNEPTVELGRLIDPYPQPPVGLDDMPPDPFGRAPEPGAWAPQLAELVSARVAGLFGPGYPPARAPRHRWHGAS